MKPDLSNNKLRDALLILVNVAPFILYIIGVSWLSSIGTGSEILFVVISPFLLLAFLVALIIDFLFIAQYLIKTQKQTQPNPRKRKAAILGLIIIGGLIYVGLGGLIKENINGYQGGRLISEAKAIDKINTCQVYDITKSDQEVALGLKTPSDPAHPPDWVTVKVESYERLVNAADIAGAKCGNVKVEDDQLVTLAEAVKKINSCQAERIVLDDKVNPWITIVLKPNNEHIGAQLRSISLSANDKDSVVKAANKATINCGSIPIEDSDV